MKVLAMVPAYNEENTVREVVQGILAQGIDTVVINDGSADNTAEKARGAGADVIDLPFNLGIGGAVQTGYIYALRNNYDIAVQIDGDGQHDPVSLTSLIQPLIDNEADMVLGSRFLKNQNYRSSAFRRMGMIFFTGLVSLNYRRWITDTTSGYRAVNRELIELFAEDYPSDYPEVEVLVRLRVLHKRVKEVPVVMNQRSFGSSSITPAKSIYYMSKVTLAIIKNLKRRKRYGL